MDCLEGLVNGKLLLGRFAFYEARLIVDIFLEHTLCRQDCLIAFEVFVYELPPCWVLLHDNFQIISLTESSWNEFSELIEKVLITLLAAIHGSEEKMIAISEISNNDP